MKHQRAGNSWSLFERTGQPVRVPTRKYLNTFVNFWFVSKPRSGKDLQFRFFSLFTALLITNNGRLDQRAWFKNGFLEDFWKWCPNFRWVTTDTQRHRKLNTPPASLHLWEDQRVWYIGFGALQLASTPDLSKRPQNKNKSWQYFFTLFAFTNKQ